jgi:hypothetical protein
MHRRWQPDTLAKAVKGQTPTKRLNKRTIRKSPRCGVRCEALATWTHVTRTIDPGAPVPAAGGPLPAALLLTRVLMRRSALLSGIPVLIARSGSLAWRLLKVARS